MTEPTRTTGPHLSVVWILLFLLLSGYVCWRMDVLPLAATVAGPEGPVSIANTFASVDHPFHVARADTLWRELRAGRILRWVGQHQGGYPVEFYPLGEAWFEVAIRALSFGSLSAAGAHTVAVCLIFLAPGAAFAAMAEEDRLSPAVALLALSLHVALPGGWYDGGYTELVQWGLVTNVAGSVAALLMFPALIRFLDRGAVWAGVFAALLASVAVYTNPRSLVGLAALGAGAWLVQVMRSRNDIRLVSLRLGQVALVTGLLAAPELLALVRYGNLYTFVQYSGYESIASFAVTTAAAVGLPVLMVAAAGLVAAVGDRKRLAMRATAMALVAYVALTLVVAFVPLASRLASQLEPTRLMPLQRLLTLYLAAAAIGISFSWLGARLAPRVTWLPSVAIATAATAVLLLMTRPLPDPMPDPASPTIPPAGLYAVARSAQPEQVALEAAVRAADDAALPGTAVLVLGSALSWHQQLWVPIWTDRLLFYDNWLWYWHPWHRGTPGYRPELGHHYPDPEATLDRAYLQQHGIGAVVVTGSARDMAAASPLLRSLRHGVYDAYIVVEPRTVLTFGAENATQSIVNNQQLGGYAEVASEPVLVRQNWHPRWSAMPAQNQTGVTFLDDGYMEISSAAPAMSAELRYTLQPADWLARGLAGLGLVMAIVQLARGSPGQSGRRWYSPPIVSASAERGGGAPAAPPGNVH